MSQKLEKDNSGSATITELVAKSEKTGSQFLKSADETRPVEQIRPVEHEQSDDRSVGGEEVAKDSSDVPPPADECGMVYIEQILRNNNMLVKGSQLGPQFADEYRRIKRPLLSNAFGKTASLQESGNLILITSSVPGEGKTHTAINLALSIAHERDHTVLLVDCDVTRHGASHALNITDKPGLVDILVDDCNVGDAILRTDIPELCLISAGRQHEYVTELLSSQKMSDFVREIGQRYDDRVIIFDGPPLLSTPQTQVLTGLVGQVVFVIEAGNTPQMLVEEALDMISDEQATGLVMNKSEGINSRSNYYYGYYGSK